MKKKCLTMAAVSAILLSSCATIFTPSRQSITFSGLEGTKIFDTSTNIKIAEIGSDKTATVSVKKKMSDKQLIAKKDGYKSSPIILESSFNTTSLWNLLFWPGFIVDLGTGQMNKWDNTYINVELEKDSSKTE
ncbi:MAG: hypothetical protein ACK5M3_14985 [Dysgonomonas sp.]